ncbi:response regulator transcription factor [Sphingomonas sp. LHG3406-1]|uniref:response regulator transcription factor n=1 Tax=Sphingomonas sp. LHG3406-1 TaxID=2804617 RepID=UPI00261FADF6|nr:response regulator transcription factor [Sphingomonas sp. LHG3406-1]
MKLLIVDDHEMLRGALASYLQTDPDCRVHEAEDVPSALRVLRKEGPFDVVLLDFHLPGMDGLDGLREIMAANQDRPVALFSGSADSSVAAAALRCGASAFLSKTMPIEELKLELGNIVANRAPTWLPGSGDIGASAVHLTPRQEQVLQGIRNGQSSSEIARDLSLQETTVRMTMKLLFAKLRVEDGGQAPA